MYSKNPVAAIHPPTLPISWWTSKVAFGKFFLVSDMRVKMSQLQLLRHRETWDSSTRGSCSPLQMKAYTRWQQLQQISQPLWSGKSIGGQKTVSQKSNFGNSYCTKFILGLLETNVRKCFFPISQEKHVGPDSCHRSFSTIIISSDPIP